jgi:3-hydroxy-5-methyl-1-naphthoate 3-O-methyltransferase
MTQPNHIMDMASAFYDSCVLFAASDAGVFGKLAELERANASAIARALHSDLRGTRLLLDACVALGLLAKDGDEYANTSESAAFLVPGAPGDLSRAIRYNRDVYSVWGKLENFVSDGKAVEKPEIHLGEDPERTRTFVLSMHARALAIGRAVVPQLDLAGCKRLLDVGGGPGTYSVLMAQANPDLTCTVLDLPAVVAIASELIEQHGMAERVSTLAGNYRTADFPAGLDAVNFFGCLHQESPEGIRQLFKKAHEALNPGGMIHVMDIMTDATHAAPKFSALFAVNMALTTHDGWVFSDEELVGWLEEAGFVQCHVEPLQPPMPHWLATARKA